MKDLRQLIELQKTIEQGMDHIDNVIDPVLSCTLDRTPEFCDDGVHMVVNEYCLVVPYEALQTTETFQAWYANKLEAQRAQEELEYNKQRMLLIQQAHDVLRLLTVQERAQLNYLYNGSL